jgi:hypothetical protein
MLISKRKVEFTGKVKNITNRKKCLLSRYKQTTLKSLNVVDYCLKGSSKK